MTVYFLAYPKSSADLRAGLVQSYQALLRDRLHNPEVVIHDVTRR